MKQDSKNYRDFFTTYATGNSYSFREVQQPRPNGNDPERQFRQSAKKLPIIYDSEPRSSTPTKQPGSSRVVYGDRDKFQKQISTPVVKYQSTSYNQIRGGGEQQRSISQYIYTQTKVNQQGYTNQIHQMQMVASTPPPPIQSLQLNEPASSRSRTIIAGLSQSRPDIMQTNSYFQPNQKVQITLKEKKQIKMEPNNQIGANIQPNKTIYDGAPIIPPLLGNNVIKSYVTSEVVHSPVPEFGKLSNLPANPGQIDYNNNNIPIQGLSFSRLAAPNPSNTKPKQPLKVQPVSDSRQTRQHVNEPRQVQQQQARNQFNTMGNMQNIIVNRGIVQGVSHLSAEAVPRVQYDKCVNQCKNWETKYNQLYLKYMNLASSMTQTNEAELNALRQENTHMKHQLVQQQQKMRLMMPMLQQKFIKMVNQQREATIKESMLLIERFKLQSRQNQF